MNVQKIESNNQTNFKSLSELLNRTTVQAQTKFILDELVNDRDFEVFMCKNYPQLIYDTPTGKKWREGKKNEN